MLTLHSTGNHREQRLDASESIWFRDQLRVVDETLYDEIFEDNLARKYIPNATMKIADWAKVFMQRQLTQYGKAKIVTAMSDDIPRVDVSGLETPMIIKLLADAYGYSVMDIKAAIATGTDLDGAAARAARRGIETLTDELISLGSVEHNIFGALKLDTIASITPIVAITKTGGGTFWSAAATPTEMTGDVFKLIAQTVAKLKGAGGAMFQKFRIVMPDGNYLRLAQTGMGDTTGRSMLEYLLKDPYIESINPWHRCVDAAANGVDDRMMAFPPTPSVLGAVVPMEFTPQPMEQRNLEYVINCLGSCGGVSTVYPLAIGYMDAIDATA